ncbi:hypothetical protein ACH5RR_014896 [Cinchona calisaya]|uniref:Gnk2-homologous domain-containing protein n=1 Tax=Cinchona calisaya TaxID=153742 RepID=A0ABD2ZV63_9GENT
MISRNILIVLCCLLCLLNFDNRVVIAQDPPVIDCVNSSTYNPNTTAGRNYQTNLNFLLSTLSSNASRATANGFYNFTAGNGNDPSSTVYGLFLCRGDVNTDVCAQCVANASRQILQSCRDQKTAIIWYNYCLLRYSNESMFSREDRNIIYYIWITQNALDPEIFNPVLGKMMDRIVILAANDSSGKKFAVQESDCYYSTFQRRIYAFGQCTPDLSSDDCENCLRNAIAYLPTCCNNSQGAVVLFPSCKIMYDLNKFYNSVTPILPPPPPPPPPPPTPASNRGKSRLSIPVTIGIVISTILSLMLLVTIFVFLKRRSRRRYDANMQETIDRAGLLNIDPESLKYSLSEIQIATNYFSVNNKIGEGMKDVSSYYKFHFHIPQGTLPNGQDIAVKRLSTRSGQEQKPRLLPLRLAWQQWREGTPLALLDPTIGDSYVKTEVLRCIHVGLLCVEEDATRRPRMASVVYMLDSNSVSLPSPYLPAVSRHNKSESLVQSYCQLQ